MLQKRFKNALLIMVFSIVMFSCKKDDDDDATLIPPRDRQEQYLADKDSLNKYFENHYMIIDADLNVTIAEIPDGNTELISIKDQTEYPLQFINVKNDTRTTYLKGGRIDDPVDYELYYILLNEGGGQQITTIDSAFVDYRGWNMNNVQFDVTSSPVWTSFPGTSEFISGFRQVLPLLKTPETVTSNGDGTITYINYGNCVVFIPSGLAYFNSSRGTNIPAYSNLAFQIKLKGFRYNDHDRDKILSKDEFYGATGDDYDYYFNQDTDGDLIPDFLDTDDDGDGIITKNELKIPGTIPQLYYQFNDIPDCSGDQVNPARLKKHRDPSCQ